VTLLLANVEVCIYRGDDLTAGRGGLVDPWGEPAGIEPIVTPALTAVEVDIPMCLQGPYLTGSREGGTRQQIEWEAKAEPGIDVAPGDTVVDRLGQRSWHVLYAVSRQGAAGTVLDHVQLRLLSVRGETDTAI
jgi:hypothetical protein